MKKMLLMFFLLTCIFIGVLAMELDIETWNNVLDRRIGGIKDELLAAVRNRDRQEIKEFSKIINGDLVQEVEQFQKKVEEEGNDDNKWRVNAILFGLKHLQEIAYERTIYEKISDIMCDFVNLFKQCLMGDGEFESGKRE